MDFRHCRTSIVTLAALLGAALLSGPGEAACPLPLDLEPVPLDTGGSATGLVAADFDGDGRADVAFGRAGEVEIRFDATGGMPESATLTPHFEYRAVLRLRDVDGDGRDALAVLSGGQGGGGVLWADIWTFGADRSYQLVASLSTFGVASGYAAGDYDADGDIDLAFGHPTLITILSQTGDWTFSPVTIPNIPMGFYTSRDLFTGDFNGDGRDDVARIRQNRINLVLFDGPGLAYTTGETPLTAIPGSGLAADLNHDGRDDVVLPTTNGTGVQVLRSEGSTLTLLATLATTAQVEGVAAGDLDADGNVDLFVPDASNGAVNVFRSDGAFAFSPEIPLAGAGTASSIAMAQQDDDPELEPIVANLLGAGIVGYPSRAPFVSVAGCVASSTHPEEIHVADLDDDGRRDFAVLSPQDATVSRYLTDVGWASWTRVDFPVEAAAADFALVDLDADGAIDLLTLHTSLPPRLIVRRGDGAGGYLAPSEFAAPTGSSQLEIADLDLDGALDAIVLSAGGQPVIRAYRGDGAGGLAPIADISLSTGPRDFAVRQVIGDGRPDLILAGGGTPTVRILPGTPGAEPFGGELSFDVTGGVVAVDVFDANGDGRLDIATASGSQVGPSILLAQGDDGFAPAVQVAAGAWSRMLRGLDYDGDGEQDLAVVSEYAPTMDGPGSVTLLRGHGDGTFEPAGAFVTGGGPAGLDLADVTGDDRPDILITQQDDETVLIAANILGGTVDVPVAPRVSALFTRVAPSPSFGAFGVELSGRPDQSVRVELYDVAGRKVGTPRVTQLGADGRGRLALDAGGRPGVYFVRSTQGSDVHVTRAVVLP